VPHGRVPLSSSRATADRLPWWPKYTPLHCRDPELRTHRRWSSIGPRARRPSVPPGSPGDLQRRYAPFRPSRFEPRSAGRRSPVVLAL